MKEKQGFEDRLDQACHLITPVDVSDLMPEDRGTLVRARPSGDVCWKEYYGAKKARKSGGFYFA
jgi:hypothetical protein